MADTGESTQDDPLFILPEISAGKVAPLLNLIRGSDDWTAEKRERTLSSLRHELSRVKIIYGIRKGEAKTLLPAAQARKQRQRLRDRGRGFWTN